MNNNQGDRVYEPEPAVFHWDESEARIRRAVEEFSRMNDDPKELELNWDADIAKSIETVEKINEQFKTTP